MRKIKIKIGKKYKILQIPTLTDVYNQFFKDRQKQLRTLYLIGAILIILITLASLVIPYYGFLLERDFVNLWITIGLFLLTIFITIISLGGIKQFIDPPAFLGILTSSMLIITIYLFSGTEAQSTLGVNGFTAVSGIAILITTVFYYFGSLFIYNKKVRDLFLNIIVIFLGILGFVNFFSGQTVNNTLLTISLLPVSLLVYESIKNKSNGMLINYFAFSGILFATLGNLDIPALLITFILTIYLIIIKRRQIRNFIYSLSDLKFNFRAEFHKIFLLVTFAYIIYQSLNNYVNIFDLISKQANFFMNSLNSTSLGDIFLGVGANPALTNIDSSTFTFVITTTGLVGVAAYMILVVSIAVQIYRLEKRNNSLVLWIIGIGLLTFISPLPMAMLILVWVFIVFLLGEHRVSTAPLVVSNRIKNNIIINIITFSPYVILLSGIIVSILLINIA